MRRRSWALGAGALLAVALLAAVQARHVTVLVVDVPEHRATLLIRRAPALGMRFIDSAGSLCRRQSPGSPLHSLSLPPSFCPLALASGPFVTGRNLLLRLPFLGVLERIAP